MKNRYRILTIVSSILLLACLFPEVCPAETYQLHNGQTIDGEIARVEGSDIVMKTRTGYSTLHINEFEYETKKSIMTTYRIRKTVETASSAKEAGRIILSDREYTMIFSGIALIVVAYIWLAIVISSFLAGLAFSVLRFRKAAIPLLLAIVGIGLVVFGILEMAEATPSMSGRLPFGSTP